MAGPEKTHKGHYLCTLPTVSIRPLTSCRKIQVCTCMYCQYTCVARNNASPNLHLKKGFKALPSLVPTNTLENIVQ
jgi:hypothetical protein